MLSNTTIHRCSIGGMFGEHSGHGNTLKEVLYNSSYMGSGVVMLINAPYGCC